MAAYKSNNAYLQCIAKIGCNITINSGCNYVKSEAKSFNIPAMPAAGPYFNRCYLLQPAHTGIPELSLRMTTLFPFFTSAAIISDNSGLIHY